MYFTILTLHSILRWVVLSSLIYAIFRAFKGYNYNLPFSKLDDSIRHWTATLAHIQLVIGVTVYLKSPIVKSFLESFKQFNFQLEPSFFGWMHGTFMVLAILIVTFGSALTKRNTVDKEKFKIMFIWYSVGLFLILIAIPWPFSPLATRPFFRFF